MSSDTRYVEIAGDMLSVIKEDDNFSDAFNALGAVLVGLVFDYILAEGQEANRENIAHEFNKFMGLIVRQADFALSNPNVLNDSQQ
jgi:hypothetical protein